MRIRFPSSAMSMSDRMSTVMSSADAPGSKCVRSFHSWVKNFTVTSTSAPMSPRYIGASTHRDAKMPRSSPRSKRLAALLSPSPFSVLQVREPDRDLARGRLGRVGAVDEVLQHGRGPMTAQVAADGAGRSRGGVCGARERAEALVHALALCDHRERGAGEHELDEWAAARVAD